MEFLLADHSCVWRVRGCGSGCGGAPVSDGCWWWQCSSLTVTTVHWCLAWGWGWVWSAGHCNTAPGTRQPAPCHQRMEDGGRLENEQWPSQLAAPRQPRTCTTSSPAQPPHPAPPPAAPCSLGAGQVARGGGGGGDPLRGQQQHPAQPPCRGPGPAPAAASPAPPPGGGWPQQPGSSQQPWTSMRLCPQSSPVLAGLRGWGQARPVTSITTTICTVSPSVMLSVKYEVARWNSKRRSLKMPLKT